MTVTYRGVASISLVVLMFLVFSEPVMSAGAIATLVGTSLLAAATVAVVTRLARKSLAAATSGSADVLSDGDDVMRMDSDKG
jgi:hypothetical protein